MNGSNDKKRIVNDSSFDWSFKPLAIIGILIILYQIGLFVTIHESGYNVTDTVYLVLLGLIGVFSITVSRKFQDQRKLGRIFIVLGIGYFTFLIGDIAFYYHDYVLEIEPYPSPFDILFLVGYAAVSYHLISYRKYFSEYITLKEKIVIMLVPVLITSVYAITALQQWGLYEGIEFDIIWGSLFTIGSSIILVISITTGIAIRRKVNEVSIILPMAIGIGMIADIWYYYLETFEAYYSSHVVNTVWIASFLLIIYSLIIHKEKSSEHACKSGPTMSPDNSHQKL